MSLQLMSWSKMIEFIGLKTLRAKGLFWILGSLALGIVATYLWTSSQSAWQQHLNKAYISGAELYSTLRFGTLTPPNISIEPFEGEGEKDQLPSPDDQVASGFVTSFFINTDTTKQLSGERLQLHIVSPEIRYPISKLDTNSNRLPSAQLGDVTRLIANYCSNPALYARLGSGQWQQIRGEKIWGCGAAPTDLRIPAALLLVLGVTLILSQLTDTATQFKRFTQALKQQRLGPIEPFDDEGPLELQEIKNTLNEYLSMEQDRLAKRAMVMSGVSHDLGTPATRLRLRTALIEDDELRDKLEADIDQMTGMIESVLTYTRSEMNSEEARQISLTSLVQSIVADYADIDKPVRYCEADHYDMDKSQSVFGRGGSFPLAQEESRRTLVSARPISIRRAISNLIDNSLKYGRKATVSVIASADMASIVVEDEGSQITEEVMTKLIAPFERGENADYIEGVGLGLTIVSTIARQHGGDVNFEQTSSGLRSTLTISR